MKRGGKVTRVPEAILAEQKVLKDYKRKVVEANTQYLDALTLRIAELKEKRNEALESIRKGEKLDAEAKKVKEDQTTGSDEASRSPGQEGHEPERSAQSCLEGQRQKGKKGKKGKKVICC